MKFKLLTLGLLAALASPVVLASEPSYTYAEGGYTNLDGDARGAYLKGSYDIANGFYAHGGYSHLELDNRFGLGSRDDASLAELGLGWRYRATPKTDVLVEAAAARVDTDFGDANGYRAAVGARFDLAPAWEASAKVNHYDGHDFSSATTGSLGVQYKFNQRWGVVAEAEFGDNMENYQVGVRANF